MPRSKNFFTNLKLYHTHFLWQKSFFARQLLPEKIKIFHFEKSSFSKFFPTLQIKKRSFFQDFSEWKKHKDTKTSFFGCFRKSVQMKCCPFTLSIQGMSKKCFPSFYLSSLLPIFHFTSFSTFDQCQKTAFLNLKGGKKLWKTEFFEMENLDFLRKELSSEKTFLSQEVGMIKL